MNITGNGILYISIATIIVIVLFSYFASRESFDIDNYPLSSAWEFTGTGGSQYGNGLGSTGYSMFGVWPGDVPNEPWKWWMWKSRMPRIMKTPFTPAPQIDYNGAPDPNSLPVSNLKVDIVNGKLAVNGIPQATLQLDRNRTYFFNVFTPGTPFMFSADGIDLYPVPSFNQPLEMGLIELQFTDNMPDVMYYTSPGLMPDEIGGIIYLNNMVSY